MKGKMCIFPFLAGTEAFAVQLLWILTMPITDPVDDDGSFSAVTVRHIESYLETVPLQVTVLGHPLACRSLTQKTVTVYL